MGKGTVFDIMIMAAILFLVAIGVIISHYVITQFDGAFSSSTAISVMNSAEVAIETFNYGFVIIMGGLGIGIILLTTLLPTNPVFIIMGIILLAIFMLVFPQLSNAYWTFTQDANMAVSAAEFPIMNHIMNALPFYMAVLGCIVLIVYYMKWKA